MVECIRLSRTYRVRTANFASQWCFLDASIGIKLSNLKIELQLKPRRVGSKVNLESYSSPLPTDREMEIMFLFNI